MSAEQLVKAIDAYTRAHEARQCCPPDKQEFFDKLAESAHEKVCEAMDGHQHRDARNA